MNRNIVFTVALVGAAFLAGLAVAQTATQTGREPQFENSSVKVWKSLGSMKILEDTGKSEAHEWQTGKAYWLDANTPGTRHQDINVGDAPIEVMVVELQNEK